MLSEKYITLKDPRKENKDHIKYNVPEIFFQLYFKINRPFFNISFKVTTLISKTLEKVSKI